MSEKTQEISSEAQDVIKSGEELISKLEEATQHYKSSCDAGKIFDLESEVIKLEGKLRDRLIKYETLKEVSEDMKEKIEAYRKGEYPREIQQKQRIEEECGEWDSKVLLLKKQIVGLEAENEVTLRENSYLQKENKNHTKRKDNPGTVSRLIKLLEKKENKIKYLNRALINLIGAMQ